MDPAPRNVALSLHLFSAALTGGSPVSKAAVGRSLLQCAIGMECEAANCERNEFIKFDVHTAIEGEPLCSISIGRRAQVFDLKLQIAETTGIPPSVQGLCVGGRLLRDLQNLQSIPASVGTSITASLLKCSGGHAPADYMSRQPTMNDRSRRTLVSAMADCSAFLPHSNPIRNWRQYAEILARAVAIVDQYLARCQVKQTSLLLVGVTAYMLIATQKFDAHEIVDRGRWATAMFPWYVILDAADVLEMECHIHQTLGFQLLWGNVVEHLQTCEAKPSSLPCLHCIVALHLAKTSLLNIAFLAFLPYDIALAADLLSEELAGPCCSKGVCAQDVSAECEAALGILRQEATSPGHWPDEVDLQAQLSRLLHTHKVPGAEDLIALLCFPFGVQ